MADLIVRGEQRFEGDVAIAGWVEVHGSLIVEGDLTCFGVSIEPGGAVRCRALVTNVIEIDGLATPALLEATSVRARFAALVQTASAAIDQGTIDYVHHFAGDLNPSFDYERGERIVEVEGEEPPLGFDLGGLRAALCSGRNPFLRRLPIVTGAPVKPVAAADPLADELAAWAAKHPGPQRQLLDDLRDWTERLRGGGPAIERAIKKAVGSPKLAQPRDAWIAELGLAKTAKAEAPIVGRDALAVRTDPPKRHWLDDVPLDSDQLYGSDQRLTELPATIARYTRVTRVQLAYNKLTRLPPELWRLPIEYLDLRYNQLTALPDQLRELTALQTLILESNPIARLPGALCELIGLRELDLQGLPITELPADLGRLTSLRFVSLEGCKQLARLPESFFALPNLETLSLHGTRLPGADLARLRKAFPASVFGNFFTG